MVESVYAAWKVSQVIPEASWSSDEDTHDHIKFVRDVSQKKLWEAESYDEIPEQEMTEEHHELDLPYMVEPLQEAGTRDATPIKPDPMMRTSLEKPIEELKVR